MTANLLEFDLDLCGSADFLFLLALIPMTEYAEVLQGLKAIYDQAADLQTIDAVRPSG